MGLFDSLKKIAADAAKDAIEKSVSKALNKKETFTFNSLPLSLEQMKNSELAALDTPFKTAALTVCALCVFGENKEEGIKMLNYLKGPAPLSPMEINFLNDRFMDGKKYVPYSYFEKATPENNYTPAVPFVLKVETNPYSFDQENYATLWLQSGGADSLRQVTLRLKPSTNQWFLNEQYLMVDIRKPKEQDPWA